MEKRNNRGLIIVLILIIVILSILCILFATDMINIKSNAEKEQQVSDNVGNSLNDESNESYDYIKATNDKIKVGGSVENYIGYADVSVKDGNLDIITSRYVRDDNWNEIEDKNYERLNKTFSIEGEKIKYITSFYYQPGGNTLVVLFMESGNVYINSIQSTDTIDSFNNFKKTEISNAEGIIKVDVELSEYDAPDALPFYYAAVVNGEPIEISFRKIFE